MFCRWHDAFVLLSCCPVRVRCDIVVSMLMCLDAPWAGSVEEAAYQAMYLKEPVIGDDGVAISKYWAFCYARTGLHAHFRSRAPGTTQTNACVVCFLISKA